MEYFKKLAIDNLNDIQKEILTVVHPDLSQSYQYLNYPPDVLKSMPLLSKLLADLGILADVQALASITAGPQYTIIPHKDGHKGSCLSSFIALNIPVSGYRNSITSFYQPNISNIDEVLPEVVSKFGYKYRPYQYQYLDKVASLTLDTPTFIRINEIHDVVNHSDEVRHVLSIRFSPDPKVFE